MINLYEQLLNDVKFLKAKKNQMLCISIKDRKDLQRSEYFSGVCDGIEEAIDRLELTLEKWNERVEL